MTSQFEQQLRAICGLALGSTELLRPAAMANLLGDLWSAGVPDWPAACRLRGRQTAPVWQGNRAAGSQDGPSDGAGGQRRRSAAVGAGRPRRTDSRKEADDSRHARTGRSLHGGSSAADRGFCLSGADRSGQTCRRVATRSMAAGCLPWSATTRAVARPARGWKCIGGISTFRSRSTAASGSAGGRWRSAARWPSRMTPVATSPFLPTSRPPGFRLARGQFAIFFPDDAHAPLAASGSLHKVVIKVEVAASREFCC